MSPLSESPRRGGRKAFLLRINEDLWNELRQWAGVEFRSVNGQIELALKRAVDEWKKRRRNAPDDDLL
jgi:hypothetical protein